MPGVRIRHSTERNCVLTVVDPRRPYSSPYECPRCHRTHLMKTVHLDLDDTGTAIVSEAVWARLQEDPLRGGFVVVNEVVAPPPIRIEVPRISLHAKVVVPGAEYSSEKPIVEGS